MAEYIIVRGATRQGVSSSDWMICEKDLEFEGEGHYKVMAACSDLGSAKEILEGLVRPVEVRRSWND
jgi:hypothetical protein